MRQFVSFLFFRAKMWKLVSKTRIEFTVTGKNVENVEKVFASQLFVRGAGPTTGLCPEGWWSFWCRQSIGFH